MAWFTDLLAHVSPRMALRRSRYRAAFDQSRGFDGASRGRRMKHWRPGSTSANAENTAASPLLRARARDAVRNDPYARRAVSLFTECAAGIMPEPDTGNDRLDKQIRAAFEAFSETCDAEGAHDFFGLQDLQIQTIIESGDVLTRRRRRRSTDDLAVPLQLQLLEPDHLDQSRDRAGSNDVVSGIELDGGNRRKGYWLYASHPGDARPMQSRSFVSTFVPADQIAHGYVKRRPGQLTGVPMLATALPFLRDLADYNNAEQMRKKIEACFAAFVTSPDGQGALTLGANGEEEDSGDRLETFEPGMIEYLDPGEDIKFAAPTAMPGHADFQRGSLHRIATAMDMPYMLLTGDVSQSNWTNYKAGLVPFKGHIRRFQKYTYIPFCGRPMWRWFIDAAYLAGLIDEPNYAMRWVLPSMEPIDRYKEALADKLEARIGLRGMREIIRSRGSNPDKVLEDIKTWQAETDKEEIVLDSDPRKVSDAGLTQARAPGTELPPTGPTETATED